MHHLQGFATVVHEQALAGKIWDTTVMSLAFLFAAHFFVRS